MFFFQERLLFFPERLPDNFQFEFAHPFQEENLECRSGNKINVVTFNSQDPKGVIIYFHGNAGSLRTWGNVADEFLENNYDIIISDYAGYGKSKGKISEDNLFSDAQDVYKHASKKYFESKTIIYGRSLGSGIAAHLASGNNPQKLILESPYFSMKDLAMHLYPFIPSFILQYPLRTDLFLPKLKCPVFIFHGTQDEVVYHESSLKLQTLFKNGDKLFSIEGGHHNDLKNFETYRGNLKEILK